MKGAIDVQVTKIFMESGVVRIGSSKHAAKEQARDDLAKEGKPGTSQGIASKTGIYGVVSARDYKRTWHSFARFARDVYGVKDVLMLGPIHVQGYLEKRIAEGVGYNTWRKEAAHLGKMANALQGWVEQKGQRHDYSGWRQSVSHLRNLAKEALTDREYPRGFVDPGDVVRELSDLKYHLMARLQIESGARLHEITMISGTQLLGFAEDPHTGENVGRLNLVQTKGGKPRIVSLTPETYNRLEVALHESKGLIRASMGAYRTAVGRAADVAGEPVRGTHDFRYNYAQTRYAELTGRGIAPESAHLIISREMGHERPDITLHYLR